MMYDNMKRILKVRSEQEGEKNLHVSSEVLYRNAMALLSRISLRKYFSKFTPDILLRCTVASKNWLYPGDVDMDVIKAGCRKANEKMRNIYGDKALQDKNIPDPEIKELICWCVLFPDKKRELFHIAFKDMPWKDENTFIYGTPESMVVFTPDYSVPAIGDELPLPIMVFALSALIITRLIDEGEKGLVPFLIGNRGLVNSGSTTGHSIY